MLIVACEVINLAMTLLVKSYSNDTLNKFDSIILHIINFIAVLPVVDDFDSPLIITIALMLVILTLLNFISMILYLHKDNLKKIAKCLTLKN